MASFAITQDDMKGAGEDQMSAIFDALVTAAWADGNVSTAEMERFEKEVVKIPWGKEEGELVKMVHASKARVSALANREAVLDFIKGIATRLPKQETREKLLYTMELIMFTDRDFNTAEENVISAFAEAFAVPKDRREAIRAAVRA
jgi:uncharacterized tellurite resistance protein B-like protein